ncbi:NAD-dependent epimerase/dehydratase family protein [Saccharicrinis fermentans]|uniref:dTDP-glucose 4,6-dehydratase n=1 Tax=Saccharicrinis fermentans DSM 9555 = JCM 21142 TaxID=869213 RepID=W7YBD0_9BACT|nr:NAD-dependent epimerase/dehydratase family protein [Saccharicrinis fermentans]GAF04938.1 dTDP-glucose 4,6-dehydratase [Saccharicrinis fermentans DSM 9555 = JCM 21142]
MKILIVGSKGFIGSHALQYFRASGHIVYGCDVVVEYEDEHYFLVDATQPNFQEPFKAIKFDVCINCSGAASVPQSIQNPLRDFQLNTANVFLLLDSIRQHAPSCKFINMSSAAVYGNPMSLPINETHKTKPVSPYGEHKRMAEEVCQEFYTHFSIACCNLRIFSAYGEGLKKQLFWDLYKKSSDEHIKLFGTGEETRDFIFISDLLQAINLVMVNAQFKGEAINVANGNQLKIRDVAILFFKLLNYQGNISFLGNNRKGDPLNWEADITHLKTLGYKNKVSLEAGLTSYIKWIESK